MPVTRQFLETILMRKISDFKIAGGSNPGDNYSSVLFTLEVHSVDEPKPLCLLFKTFPNHPTRQKMLEDTNVFWKEYQVYDKLLPEIIRFQTDLVGLDKILKPALPLLIAGAAIDYENEKNIIEEPALKNFLLMVDVRKAFGFKMADKMSGLAYHHVKVVMEELAKLHSLTYAYRVHKSASNNRQLFSCLNDPFYNNPKQRPTIDAMLAANFKLLRSTLDEFFQDNPKISESMEGLESPGRATELFAVFLNPEGLDEDEVEGLMRRKPVEYSNSPIKDQWIVIGHGDCWTNNLLFQTDEIGNATNVILVDLQLVRDCCLMADLAYFIYTSTDTNFRQLYLNEMLEFYFNRFTYYCKKLKVEIFPEFSLENFKRKFHRSKIFGFLFACLVVPIILVKPGASLDMDTITLDKNNEDGIAAMFTNASSRDAEDLRLLKERFAALLTELYEEGVL